MSEFTNADLLDLTTGIVAAFVSNNTVAAQDLPALIASVHTALGSVGQPVPEPEPERQTLTPSQIRKSIRPDALISFEDGKPYKTMKRHLGTRGLTIEQYREKWGLPSDYPSVAPNYSAARSEMAKSLGLGQKGRQASSTPAPAKVPGKRGRPRKAV